MPVEQERRSPDTPPATLPDTSRKQFAAMALGNAIEFYDFTVYVFFAVQIGRTFFPATAALTSLLLSVAAFGVGFLTRPLGAVLVGAYADRRGRKPAMLLTVGLMAAATLVIAIVPGYATIGLAAPAIVVAARLVQGFAYGGETGPSTILLIEAAGHGRRARAMGWLTALQGGAVVAAGLVGLGLSLTLPPAALDAWGWRIAIGLGLAIVPAGLAIRAALPLEHDRSREQPVGRLLRQAVADRGAMVAAVLVITSSAVVFYVVGYMASYALTSLKLPPTAAFLATLVAGGVTIVMAPLGGLLAERVGSRFAQALPRLAVVLLAVPGFWWLLETRSAVALLVVTGFLGAANALAAPPGLCAIVEAMPAAARSTGLSLATALGASFLGGATPFIVTALIAATGDRLTPAYYLAALSFVGALAAFRLPDVGRADGRARISAFTSP